MAEEFCLDPKIFFGCASIFSIFSQILKSRLSSLLELRSQVGASAAVSLGFFTGGMVRAWASPAVPSMQSDPDYALSYAPLSKEEVSWICELMWTPQMAKVS